MITAVRPSSWTVLDLDDDALEGRHPNPFQEQIRAVIPQVFEKQHSNEVCGACVNFVRKNGEGFCRLQHFGVDEDMPLCVLFDLRAAEY